MRVRPATERWTQRADDALGTYAWQKLRLEVLAEEPLCRIQIAGVCTLVSTTVDHIKPRVVAPELTFVRSNLRGACAPCNAFVAVGVKRRSA